jgi:hypothetical protein
VTGEVLIKRGEERALQKFNGDQLEAKALGQKRQA